MIKHFKSREFLIFLLAGGCAAAVNFVSRIIYNQWIDFSLAVILAYVTGMVVAFVLFKLVVFKPSPSNVQRSVVYFVLVNFFGIAQTWLISMGLAFYVFPALDIRLLANEMAHAVGILVPAFSSYLGHKHLSFR